MAEFYAGDVFNRDGLACYATADSAKSYNGLDELATYVKSKGVQGDCGSIGTITANTCATGWYEPVALKADVSEIESSLNGVIARVAALEASARVAAMEASMPHKDNLRRQLKTLNYKREL